MNVETKQTITFSEFRAWLTGLIRGMNGQVPGIEEWKQIKQMMDKVVPDKEYTQMPAPPQAPWYKPWYEYETPDTGKWPWKPYCGGDSTTEGSATYDYTPQPTSINFNIATTNDQGLTGDQLDLAIDQMIDNNKQG